MPKRSSSSVIATAVGRIEAWISRNIPLAVSEFKPPALPKALRKAEEVLGQPIPNELSELLRLHDGISISGILPDVEESVGVTFSVCSTGELALIADSTQCLKRSFIPFASDGAGNLQGIDIARNDCVVQFDHEEGSYKKIDKSLGKYLTRVAEHIESGRYEVLFFEPHPEGEAQESDTEVARQDTPLFDESDPIEFRFFAVVNGENNIFGFSTLGGDVPFTEEMLVHAGYEAAQIKDSFLQMIAIACRCRPTDLTACLRVSDDDGALFTYSPTKAGKKLRKVYLNLSLGGIGVMLDLPKSRTRGQIEPGFEWADFISAAEGLMSLVYQGAVEIHYSKPKRYNAKLSENDFELQGTYSER